MRVLIPASDTSLRSLVDAYEAAGCEVVSGADEFAARTGSFDLVHVQWPEALVQWRTPTEEVLGRIADDITWWRARSTMVGTVHNLAPHGRHESPRDHALFAAVYAGCDLVTHFSSFSRDELIRLHPPLATARHLVHRPFLYSDLRVHSVGRGAARERLGLADGDFAIAAIGRLRERAELDLLERGIAAADVPGKRPLVTVQLYLPREARIARVVRALLPRQQKPVMASFGRLSPADMVPLFEAADVVVIPRYPPHLNSGVMQLAMTFGVPMVVPDYGVYSEYLRDAGCAFYPPRSIEGLAAAIEQVSRQHHDTLVGRNRDVAADWGWDRNIAAIMSEVAGGRTRDRAR